MSSTCPIARAARIVTPCGRVIGGSRGRMNRPARVACLVGRQAEDGPTVELRSILEFDPHRREVGEGARRRYDESPVLRLDRRLRTAPPARPCSPTTQAQASPPNNGRRGRRPGSGEPRSQASTSARVATCSGWLDGTCGQIPTWPRTSARRRGWRCCAARTSPSTLAGWRGCASWRARSGYRAARGRDTPAGSFQATAGHTETGELPEPAGERTGPLEQTIERERYEQRRAQLLSLPARQRQLLGLHGAGLTYEEIAAHTGDSRRTVERQLLRGRARLG